MESKMVKERKFFPMASTMRDPGSEEREKEWEEKSDQTDLFTTVNTEKEIGKDMGLNFTVTELITRANG